MPGRPLQFIANLAYLIEGDQLTKELAGARP
jgi:hypothetical protein